MRTYKIKLSILCLVTFLTRENMQAQFLAPGTPTQLICIQNPGDFGSSGWTWNFNPCSNDVNITSSTPFFNVLNFSINNSNCCNIGVNANGVLNDMNFNSFNFACATTFKILPSINPVGTVFPNTTFNVSTSAGGSNGLACASAHGCSGASISWAVTGGSCNFCTGTSISVGVPSNPSTNPITISANYNCGGNKALNPISVNVALHNPVITGPQSLGCGSNPSYVTSNQVTYNASSVTGAGWWVWTWPGNMSPVGNTNGQSITLNVNSPGSGNVSVQAFNANGGAVSSGVVNYGVNVCCTPVINESTTLNSGNTGYLVEAGSTINSTNDIQSTGTATMHASVEVHLLPGFNAASGCQIHMYPAACSSGYFRQAPDQGPEVVTNEETSEAPAPLPSGVGYLMAPAINNKPAVLNSTGEAGSNFKVLPNPSTGKVTVQFDPRIELPEEVALVDNFGKILVSCDQPIGNSCSFDLGSYSNGVYAVRVRYKDKIESKLLVKMSQ